nr:hypothetical protein [Tanacetum cinerariifolium]
MSVEDWMVDGGCGGRLKMLEDSSTKLGFEKQEIGAKNIRRTKHEVQNRCDDKTVDITDYEDSDQEDDELPDLPTFSVTNVFASFCEQIDENIDISVAKEIEEVQVEDAQGCWGSDVGRERERGGERGGKIEKMEFEGSFFKTMNIAVAPLEELKPCKNKSSICLQIALYSLLLEDVECYALDPWILALEQREQRSKESTCHDIYSLPLQRYQPYHETPRSCLFDLTKGGEGKQRARSS